MRIDKLLWFLRFASSRNLAHDWVLQGHIRQNGRRIEKPGHAIKPGDILTLPLPRRVAVIEILALPARPPKHRPVIGRLTSPLQIP